MHKEIIPQITPKDMADVDKVATEYFGISILQMMENAGRILAKIALKEYRVKKVVVLCGKGNNGGGGLVCAKYLKNYGVDIKVILAQDIKNKTPSHQLKIAKKIGIPISVWNQSDTQKEDISQSDLVIDALLGYNAKGAPKGNYVSLIQFVQLNSKQVLSLDVPTGLNLKTGKFYATSFKNADIVTLALPFNNILSKKEIKCIYLADIGIPLAVYEYLKISIPKNLFKSKDYFIIKI